MAATAKRRKVNPSKIRKLHELLKLAIHDLRKHERSANCVVQMKTWMDVDDGICCACLAGSVLRHTCGRKTSIGATPSWMNALDDLRRGNVASAADELGLPENNVPDRNIADYHSYRAAFWRDIEFLYRDLKAANV